MKHAALDLSLDSLGALEKLMKGKPVTEATTRAWGAYVGECMRRAHPADVAWVTYDEAVNAVSSIAAMKRGYNLEAILRVGGKTRFWFPLAKVEKYPELPFAAFAPLVTACLAPTSPHLGAALDLLSTWMFRWPHTGDIASAIPAVQSIAAKHAKPKTREQAERIVDRYALGIVHGHAAEDPRVATLVAEKRAKRAAR